MPELPEIETIRRSLAPLATGRRISRVQVRCARLRRPLASDFGSRLKGRRIERIGRRAKYLVFDLDDGLSWIVHLGMSGRLVYQQPSDPAARERHDHVVVYLGRHGRLVHVQAGAGIVADSVPETEYLETLNKARGLLAAINLAETQLGGMTNPNGDVAAN